MAEKTMLLTGPCAGGLVASHRSPAPCKRQLRAAYSDCAVADSTRNAPPVSPVLSSPPCSVPGFGLAPGALVVFVSSPVSRSAMLSLEFVEMDSEGIVHVCSDALCRAGCSTYGRQHDCCHVLCHILLCTGGARTGHGESAVRSDRQDQQPARVSVARTSW